MPYKDKSIQRKYQKEWMRSRREDFFFDKVCVWCSSTEKLELHHVNPDEKVSHRIWSWSESKRSAEIEKCIVLCNECHKHIKKGTKCSHGSSGRYRAGCRCEKCRNFKSYEMKAYRARKALGFL